MYFVLVDWFEGKLKEAGIPVAGGDVLRGTLSRLDDPVDWGTVIYRWSEGRAMRNVTARAKAG